MVGRATEAAAIARFVEQVPNGPVGLAIEGEPGMGKTMLVSEAARIASQRGYRLLEARPAEAESELSFAVLGDLLSAAFDEVRDAVPPPQRDALDLALLRTQAAEPADPRTTATALVSVLTILSERGPLVLTIDDAQWVDQASRRALQFAIRRLPHRAGILASTRITDPGASPFDLERALGAGRVQRLVIGPLSLTALHTVIRSRLGLDLPRPMLLRVAEASGGNPFFALEICDGMARGQGPPTLGPTRLRATGLLRLSSLRVHAVESTRAPPRPGPELATLSPKLGVTGAQTVSAGSERYHRAERADEKRPVILPKVRDPRFITIRRGGTLRDDDHRLLAVWAADCGEHVLHHFERARPHDDRPRRAIELARAWARGEIPWSEARTAAGHANAAARDLRGAARHAAYAAGQAAAVGHVAAHELGAAAYAIRAARAAAADDETEAGRAECRWQRARLPEPIRELVLDDQRLRNELCWFVFDA